MPASGRFRGRTTGTFYFFLAAISLAVERVPVRILGFCLMPNHFHLVLWPREDGDMGRWMPMVAHVSSPAVSSPLQKQLFDQTFWDTVEVGDAFELFHFGSFDGGSSFNWTSNTPGLFTFETSAGSHTARVSAVVPEPSSLLLLAAAMLLLPSLIARKRETRA